jgi:hypothetical protein
MGAHTTKNAKAALLAPSMRTPSNRIAAATTVALVTKRRLPTTRSSAYA